VNRHLLNLLPLVLIFLVFSPSDAEPQCYEFETVPNSNPPIKLKWPSSDIPVRFVVNYLGTPDVSNSSYNDGEFMAISEAFRTWTQVKSSYLVFQDDGIVSQSLRSGNDSLNLIVWRETVWKQIGYDEKVIAITTTWFDTSNGNIINSDMELNGVNFSWRIVGPANCIPEIDRNVVDVQNIVTHETGHMLGLADIMDTACKDVTMFYASSSCDTKRRDPTQDDITGLSTLYPATLSLQSVSPASAGNDAGVAINITGSGFATEAQVRLTRDQRPDIQAGQVSVQSSALLTCAVPLTGSSVGKWTVWVANIDGTRGKLFEGFTIIKGGTNFTPVAIAGESNSIFVGSKAVLDGSKSYDPNGAPLSYEWSVSSAPEDVSLTDPDTAYPSFVPGKSGDYVFTLIVSNGQYESQPASVTIKVGVRSSSDSGCGCVIQEGNRSGALSGGVILLCLYFIFERLRRPGSLHSPRPGRSPR